MKLHSSEPETLTEKHRGLATRDQNTTLEAAYWRDWFYGNRWNLLAALFILVFMPLGIAYMTRKTLRTIDLLKTPAKQGQAMVVSKNFVATGTKGSVISYAVTFRLNGRQITASTFDSTKWAQTFPDTTVPVTYHVGENGDVLISDW